MTLEILATLMLVAFFVLLLLGIPVGTVMSRLARGRDKIRSLLKTKISVAPRRDLPEGQAA